MKRITFVCELARNTGYGQHATEVIKALQSAGYFVALRPIRLSPRIDPEIGKLFVYCPQPEPIELILSPPQRELTPDKSTIYYTMWESSRLPDGVTARLNQTQTVVVPSRWNYECFRQQGVTVPIEIVPLGINPEIYFYRPFVDDGVFRFAAGGNLYNGAKRKGVHDVVRAFKLAFTGNPKVRLDLKITGDIDPQDGRITVNKRPMVDQELAVWYAQHHCFVSCARAEGWGLMQLQSMAVGRPVIAAVYGGLAEFMDDSVGYPVWWKSVPAEELWKGLGEWCEPNLEHLVLEMRHVYRNREDLMARGLAAANRAMGFSWQQGLDRLISVIHNVESSLSGSLPAGSEHSSPAQIPDEACAISG